MPAVPSPASCHLEGGSRAALLSSNSALRRYLRHPEMAAASRWSRALPSTSGHKAPAALRTRTLVQRLAELRAARLWPGPVAAAGACSPAGRCLVSGPRLWPPGQEGRDHPLATAQSHGAPATAPIDALVTRDPSWRPPPPLQSQEKSAITLGAAEDDVLLPRCSWVRKSLPSFPLLPGLFCFFLFGLVSVLDKICLWTQGFLFIPGVAGKPQPSFCWKFTLSPAVPLVKRPFLRASPGAPLQTRGQPLPRFLSGGAEISKPGARPRQTRPACAF